LDGQDLQQAQSAPGDRIIMKPLRNARLFGFLGLCAIALIGCGTLPTRGGSVQPIVGAWLVTIPEAPFPQHLIIFHADGTLLQSNPDAGDPRTSDSNLMGAWIAEGDHIAGRFMEVTADRSTHKLVGHGELTFSVRVQADDIRGSGSAHFFDSNGAPSGDPIAFTVSGYRIKPK
jgi:hypothetical protein